MLEPNRPFKKFYYRCDSKFHIDVVEEYFELRKWSYAVAIIGGEDAEFYRADQRLAYEYLCGTHGFIQKRQGRGGQSKNRIERLREETIHVYVKKIVERIMSLYFKEGRNIFDKLILSGATQKIRDVIELLPLDKMQIKQFNYSDIDILINKQALHIQFNDEKEISQQVQNEIAELLELKSDLLLFGDEIFENIDHVEKIYLTNDEYEECKSRIPETKTVIVNDAVGSFGKIGVKYFNSETEN